MSEIISVPHHDSRGPASGTHRHTLLEEAFTGVILGKFFDVYNRLGRGFLESVYEGAMAFELKEAGLHIRRQYPVKVHYRGHEVGHFRADILVNDRIILEIKRARRIHSKHIDQVYNVLKATRIELGLLLNFGPKPLFKRIILTNDRKPIGAVKNEPLRGRMTSQSS